MRLDVDRLAPFDRARRDAIVILRGLALADPSFSTDTPSVAVCWLLNAALHLDGRMPVSRIAGAHV